MTKATNHKDTYQATAVLLIFLGALYLLDRWLHFDSLGLPWLMQKDMMLLYAAVIFLWFKSDKSVGIILGGLWLIQNIGLVVSLLGQISSFLLPVTLLLAGIILYFSLPAD